MLSYTRQRAVPNVSKSLTWSIDRMDGTVLEWGSTNEESGNFI